MSAVIGEKAPNFGVSEWVQGAPTNFDPGKRQNHNFRSFSSKLSWLLYACIA